jgi:hypothetical protein
MQIPERLRTIGTTGFKEFKPIGATGTIVGEDVSFKGIKNYEIDLLFDSLPDLVNLSFKRWYCKMFYKLGRERVITIASIARADGKTPTKLFSKLLKEAYENLT